MNLLDPPERDWWAHTAAHGAEALADQGAARRPGCKVEARKVVRILFADLTASTALHERLNSESVRSWMERS